MDSRLISQIETELTEFGHRNWVLVVDKAYPMQNSAGIRMFDSGAPLPDVLETVSSMIGRLEHIRPSVYVDRELDFLDESYCPGAAAAREGIYSTLDRNCKSPVNSMLHEDILVKLNEVGDSYNVMVIKTESLIPYTSVFFQLECGYWSDEQESILRSKL